MEGGAKRQREPGYIEECESLLGVPFFADEREEEKLLEDFSSLDPYRIASRSLLYTRSLRILAGARKNDRRLEPKPERGSTFNERWGPTVRLLGRVASQHREELAAIRSHLEAINTYDRNEPDILDNIDNFLEGQEESPLYPDQEELFSDIVDFTHSQPQRVEFDDPYQFGRTHTRYIKGAVVVASTGSGKTVLMGYAALAMGIGRSRAEAGLPPLRLLIVVPSQELLAQFIGELGDDTFRRFSRIKSVGGYYAYCKDVDTHVVVATIDQFCLQMYEGRFAGRHFDALMIDEVHTVTQHRFYRVLLEHWHNGMVIGFTATPTYSPEKDSLNILQTRIQKGDLVSDIQAGKLNGAEIFSFIRHVKYDADGYPINEVQVLNQLDADAMTFIGRELREGRRGIVFCRSGGDVAHARRLAGLIGSHYRFTQADGSTRKATSGYLFGKNRKAALKSKAVLNDYAAGKIDVIFTTSKGAQGLNEQFDFVVVVRRVSSHLLARQIVGRGTRRSEDFPVTHYAEFIPTHRKACHISIFESFGLKKVQQGYRIVAGQGGPGDHTDYTAWPEEMQQLLASSDNQPIDKVFLSSRQEKQKLPTDYIPLAPLAEKVGIPLLRAVDILRAAEYGVAWQREETWLHQGEWYCEPAAKPYLETTSDNLAEVIEEGQIELRVLQREYGRYNVERMLKKMDIPERRRRRSLTSFDKSKEVRCFTPDEAALLRGELDKLKPEPGDMRFGELCRELSVGAHYIRSFLESVGKTTKLLIYQQGLAVYVKAEQVEQLKNKLQEVSRSSNYTVGIAEIAARAGFKERVVHGYLTKEEIEEGKFVSTIDAKKPTRRWQPEAAERIVARLWAKRKAPVGYVPLAPIAEKAGIPLKKAGNILRAAGYGVVCLYKGMGSQRVAMWYCEPAALTPFETLALKRAEVMEEGMVRLTDLFQEYGKYKVECMLKDMHITGHRRRRSTSSFDTRKEFMCLTPDEAALLRGELDKLKSVPGDR